MHPHTPRPRQLTVMATADVHGALWPHDFISSTPATGSLARACSLADALRLEHGAGNVLVLDGGDTLQGAPGVDALGPSLAADTHPAALMLKLLGCDGAVVGNHDLETGPGSVEHWRKSLAPVPLLGANVVDSLTGKPLFTPWTLIARAGMRIAVLGLTVPALRRWLPHGMWPGLEVLPMEECAADWVEYIREHVQPDAVIGLFHSGPGDAAATDDENRAAATAIALGGAFDLIIAAHDHRPCVTRMGPTLILNPGAHCRQVAVATLTPGAPGQRPVTEGSLVPLEGFEPQGAFMQRFGRLGREIDAALGRTAGTIARPIDMADCLKGPSPWMTIVHRVQLGATGAKVSVAAPTAARGFIAAGRVELRDLYGLYRYDDRVSVMRLKGSELRALLEWSYGMWAECLAAPKGETPPHPPYHLDSAMGLDYTVNLDAPAGSRVSIPSMADGSPWQEDAWLQVAMPHYRACGGGGHLTQGCGIPPAHLPGRTVMTTSGDMRTLICEYLKHGAACDTSANWHFEPHAAVQ